MINAASSRLQTNQVIESKNTSFTVTHLVLKIKEVPSKTENGKKWLDIYDVDVHSNAPASQSKAAILFSLFEPSGFFTLQLNLSWRHSRARSSLAWPLSFNYVHCKLDFFLASFTVTHLVLKIKEVPSKTENGKNDWTFTMSTFIPTHQRAKVRQRSSLVCSSLQVFSRCNSIFPGVILELALLLHGLFSFNYVHCKLDLLLAPTARQSDWHRRARGLAGFSRWRSSEQRRSWNCGAQSASAQRSTGSFTCDWEKENVKKAQCWENMKRAKRGC